MPTPEQNLGVNMTGAKMSGRAKMSGLVCWRLDDFAMDKHQEPVKRCEQNEPQQKWQNQFTRDRPKVAGTWSWACDCEPQTSSFSNRVWNAVAHPCVQHDIGDRGIFEQLQLQAVDCWSYWSQRAE